MALTAAFAIAVLATPAGISGALLLLPFQVRSRRALFPCLWRATTGERAGQRDPQWRPAWATRSWTGLEPGYSVDI